MNKSTKPFAIAVLAASVVAMVGLAYAQIPDDRVANDPISARDSASAQPLAEIRQMYREMSQPAAAGVCRCEYSVTMATRQEDRIDTSSSAITYLASADRVHMVSHQLSMYQDDSLTVTVMPGRQSIMVLPSVGQPIREKRATLFQAVQDTLFSDARIEETREITDRAGKRVVEYTIQPSETIRKTFGIDRMRVRIDQAGARLSSIRVDFAVGAITFAEVAYADLVCSESHPDFDRPVGSFVFDEAGELLARYRGFDLVDRRGS